MTGRAGVVRALARVKVYDASVARCASAGALHHPCHPENCGQRGRRSSWAVTTGTAARTSVRDDISGLPGRSLRGAPHLRARMECGPLGHTCGLPRHRMSIASRPIVELSLARVREEGPRELAA